MESHAQILRLLRMVALLMQLFAAFAVPSGQHSAFTHFAVEVFVGNSEDPANSRAFVADSTQPDYGAKTWCRAHNSEETTCIRGLGELVRRGLAAQALRPQSQIEKKAASPLQSSIFPEPHACTDRYHTLGRCMVFASLARYLVQGGVPGDYVEAGVHLGDSAAAVAGVFAARGSHKRMWLYDSFRGMPEADESVDGIFAKKLSPAANEGIGWGAEASAASVITRLAALGIVPPQVLVREGWFNETFPLHTEEEGPVSFLMVDCDWYGSVLETLETFYDRVVPGGVVLLDDFGYWEGARRALGDFIRSRPGMEMPLVERHGPDILWFFKGNVHNRDTWISLRPESDFGMAKTHAIEL